jgi:microcystin-dependent protein
MSDIQIGQLPLTTSMYDASQLPIETANVTYKIYGTSIKDYVTSLAFLNSAGNVTAANLVTAGNVYSGNLVVADKIYGALSVATQLGITRTGTLGVLAVAGNVTAGNVASTQVQADTAIFEDLYGTLQTVSQPMVTSVGTLTGISVNGDAVLSGGTGSSSSSTGALVVVGGVGVSGNLNVDGYIKTPTPTLDSNSTQVATTEWVKTYATVKADLNSPNFTGLPTFPEGTVATTQTPGTSNSKLATTEFVNEANVGLANRVNYLLSSKAPLTNPSFSGNVTGITKLMVGLGLVDNTNDASKPVSAPTLSALNLKANIASPTFTGTVTLPPNTVATTQPTGTSNTAVATTSFVNNALASAVPTGTVLMWPSTSAPSGYLICTGSAISRTTFASLFLVIGTTFGVGDNTTTFNLPNFTNRMPYGPGSAVSVGSTGGSKDSVAIAHSHTISGTANQVDLEHDHNESFAAPDFNAGPVAARLNVTGVQRTTGGMNQNRFHSHTVSGTTDTGKDLSGSDLTGGTGQNLPPYLGINFIIKT